MQKIEEKIASMEKIKKMHGEDFNPAKIKKIHFHENPFLGKNEKLTYSFLSDGDPYEQLKTEAMRNRWIEEAKLLFGDFMPSGANRPI